MRGWGFLLIAFSLGPRAHAISCLSENPVTIAILDSGIDAADMAATLWINKGETRNGIDDDGNGLVDDVHGWNFLDHSADLTDRSGHGTHIAGLIRQYAPVGAPRFMVLKYFDPGRRGPETGPAFAAALAYALNNGADIIHVSGGGYRQNATERALFEEADHRGIPVIAASGNKRSRAADRDFFPAAYPMKNIFSVSAIDDGGHVLPTSNVVPRRKNFFERGLAVLSVLPGARTGRMTGTSQAAGIFTGKFIAGLRRCDVVTRL